MEITVDHEKEEALKRLEKAYGAGAKKGRNITDEDIHRIRKKAFKELAKEHGINLD